MCYKENTSQFFNVMKNYQIFSSNVCNFQNGHRFPHLIVQESKSAKTYSVQSVSIVFVLPFFKVACK